MSPKGEVEVGRLVMGKLGLKNKACKPVGPDVGSDFAGVVEVAEFHEGSGKFELAKRAQKPVVDDVCAVDAAVGLVFGGLL